MNTITLSLLTLIIACGVGIYFVYSSINSLAQKQDELTKDLADIKHTLNDVKVTVDRINGVAWTLKDKIEDLKFYGDYEDLLDEDDD